MLALLGSAALVLVAGAPWVLLAAAGAEDLEPPEDVDVYIIDDNFTLRWSSKNESLGSVTFSAEYQIDETENWLKLPGCQHVTGTECKFSLLNTSMYVKMKFRVRAETGKFASSWTEVDPFIPFLRAHIGPPGVRLAAEDQAVIVYISHPGQGGKMWSSDILRFEYRVVIWQKSSNETQSITTTYYTEKISKLLPETTYCLKVKAIHSSLGKHSNYSAVQCINTTEASKMPVPENIEVDARGESYVLKWDCASTDVSFRAQWLPGYFKSISGSSSNEWKPIPTCADVQTTHCVFPKNTIHTGLFFLRVQAFSGKSTSFWSEDKLIDSQKYTTIPPPVLAVTPTRDSLLVYVSCQDNSSSKCHGLTYEIIFWEKTSSTKRNMVKESPEFTIENLQPQTVYCVQARVLLFATWNRSSSFTDVLCEKTRPGHSSSMIWIITGFGTLFFSVFILYAGKNFLKYLNYVFFSSPKPPASIDEFFSEPPSKNLLFLTPEEHTERCFIIENTDTVAVTEENHTPEEEHRKYTSQTSQDSGNYSNEEENTTGSESSQGLRL
ncbi:interferon alpha/beta receptor 1 isoform X2 [Cricetulus griseus]|uniref:Interferon alpha/beta receptor 1 n=1 Tax=Cricetulus griseus TaxID=10029 RepID=A0A9J7GVC3_CRIGR|nr:interferon alpha/beta receptor 1 isoform X2 [Cricetulus griseus]